MKFGVTMFPTGYSIRPAELATALEERGFESLFFPEHTHIPTSRRTPWPGGAELPQEYAHTLDLFVALSAAATATQHLIIGTGICLVIERDPITLAKEVASLDFISRGRFLFGIGAGWNQEEMENHGTNPTQRWSLLRETNPGHEGELDSGRGSVSRPLRRLRPHLVPVEARPEASPTDPCGW